MIINCIALVGGVVVPVVVYQRLGWWLNSGLAVSFQSTLLFWLGLLTTLLAGGQGPSLTWWFPAFFAAAGAIASSTVILFWTGPGDLFPIVLAFVHVISTAAVFAGAAAVVAPRLWLRRHRRVSRMH